VEEGDEGKKVVKLHRRIAWVFPDGDLEKCIEFLQNNIREERDLKMTAVPEPLRMADFLSADSEEDGGDGKCLLADEETVDIAQSGVYKGRPGKESYIAAREKATREGRGFPIREEIVEGLDDVIEPPGNMEK
jgi:hypothetical protein